MKFTQEKAASILKVWLRIVGASMLLAIIAVFMPTSWLRDAIHSLEPDTQTTLLIQYLARALSMFYFMVGGLFWIFAGDIYRYAKPIHFTAYCYVMACTIALMFVVIMQVTLGGISEWLFFYMVTDFILSICMASSVLFLLFRSGANLD